jgi:aminoglycoside phosphotransferase (APT) family kinase protein
VDDVQWIGSSFLVMPRVRGYIPGPAPAFDEVITAAPADEQGRIHDGLVDTLAALHAVDWAAPGLGSVLPGPSVADALDAWGAYVDWAGEGAPLPALRAALEWCRANRPDGGGTGPPVAPGPVLLWGDPRLGNLVFDDERRVHAVLDWDLAALGPPEMDLGWVFGLDFMMEQLFGTRVPGFPTKADALARYEARSGHTVRALDFHEVFALMRALAINDRHQRIAAAAHPRAHAGGATRPRENPMGQVLLARMAAAG